MRGDRPADLKYLIQLAQAAEINGFEAVLTPTGLWCEDAWLTTAMLIGSTESLKYLVAFRPGLISPTLAAQMAATFQWQSRGRLMLNVVTGGDDAEPQVSPDGSTLYFNSSRSLPIDPNRTRAQFLADAARLDAWDNGNSNVWTLPLRPLLDALRGHR